MLVYVFKASLLCKECGELVKRSLVSELHREDCGDSDYYPQGPYGNGGGEADAPQHCDHCGLFLENPLTSDGIEYVREAEGGIADQWREFYGIEKA